MIEKMDVTDYKCAVATTEHVLLHTAEENIREDTQQLRHEMPSIITVEETKDIPHVEYEQAQNIIHLAGLSACPSSGPQACLSGLQKQKIAKFSEVSLDEYITPPETPAKVLVQ